MTTIPTIGFNVETVTYKNLKFQVWDLGGQTSIRPYWRCYYTNTDAIIYVVDSADRCSEIRLSYVIVMQWLCAGSESCGWRQRLLISCWLMTDDQWSNQRKPELCDIVLDYRCLYRPLFSLPTNLYLSIPGTAWGSVRQS